MSEVTRCLLLMGVAHSPGWGICTETVTARAMSHPRGCHWYLSGNWTMIFLQTEKARLEHRHTRVAVDLIVTQLLGLTSLPSAAWQIEK